MKTTNRFTAFAQANYLNVLIGGADKIFQGAILQQRFIFPRRHNRLVESR